VVDLWSKVMIHLVAACVWGGGELDREKMAPFGEKHAERKTQYNLYCAEKDGLSRRLSAGHLRQLLRLSDD
jgi:hypothetical protein